MPSILSGEVYAPFEVATFGKCSKSTLERFLCGPPGSLTPDRGSQMAESLKILPGALALTARCQS